MPFSENTFKDIFQAMGDPSFLMKDSLIVDCNGAMLTLLGFTKKGPLLNKSLADISPATTDTPPEDDSFDTYLAHAYKQGSHQFEWALSNKDGSSIAVEIVLKPLTIDKDDILYFVCRDISQRKASENKRKASETKLRRLFETSRDAWLLLDEDDILDCNQAALDLYGCPSAETFTSVSPADFSPPKQPNGEYSLIQAEHNMNIARETGSCQFEWLSKRLDTGETFHIEVVLSMVELDGKIFMQSTARDITDRKAIEAQITQLASQDSLTGLVNRHVLASRMKHALTTQKRSGKMSALLFIDLDHFKHINNTMGHNIGDLLLQQVAERLPNCVRESDTVSRFGGDEFVIMLEELSEDKFKAASQAEVVAEKILHALNKPYSLDSREYSNTPSIGIALFSHNDIADNVLQQADIAMYQAKQSGRNAIRFFDPAMQRSIKVRVTIGHELKDALTNDEFELHYQLQIDSAHQPLGVEALIRWKHPEKGYIPPLQYIPIAEETRLIVPIGLWVLRTACQQIKTWQNNPLTENLVIAVNVSAIQFNQESYVNEVLSVVEEFGIKPHLLKLELTESMLFANVDDIIVKMTQLKETGISFSLDDFGTGYSSLQYLKQLPLDQLKIDPSFVRDVVFDEQDRSIVQTIIAMAKGLDLDVIAEGVETTEQKDMLIDFGCDHFQGYLFANPMPIKDVDKFLLKPE